MNNYQKLAASLFGFLNGIKLLHLNRTGEGSYAAHVALGELYDSVADMADDIVETMQGWVGIIEFTIPAVKAPKTTTESIIWFRAQLMEFKGVSGINKMPDICNMLDELIGTLSKTLYKLQNLR